MAERKQTRRSVREQSKAAFRTAILEAAEQVFTREGFSAAKMADIAAEAGVAAGTLYNYFGSKTEIFKSIMMAGAREFSERVERAANEPDPIERLRQVCAQALEFLGDHGSLFLIYVQLHGGTEMETYASAIEHAEMRARHLQLMVSSVRDAQAAGDLRDDLPPDALAMALSGITNGFIVRWTEQGCPAGELSPHLDAIFDLFLKGSGPQ